MKKEAGGDFSIIDMLRSYINVFSSELEARLTGVRHESWGLLVFEGGIMKEVVI